MQLCEVLELVLAQPCVVLVSELEQRDALAQRDKRVLAQVHMLFLDKESNQ